MPDDVRDKGVTLHAVWSKADADGKPVVKAFSTLTYMTDEASPAPGSERKMSGDVTTLASATARGALADGTQLVLLGWSDSPDDKDRVAGGRDGDLQGAASAEAIERAKERPAGSEWTFGDADASLYAVWTVSFDGASDDHDSVAYVAYSSEQGKANLPADGRGKAETGYTLNAGDVMAYDGGALPGGEGVAFLGWSTEAGECDLVVADFSDAPHLVKGDLTLGAAQSTTRVYAVWASDSDGDGTPDCREQDVQVRYEFVASQDSTDAGHALPDAVKGLCPAGLSVKKGQVAVAPTGFAQTVDDPAGGWWGFEGWAPASKETEAADVNGGVTFTGTWTWHAAGDPRPATHRVSFSFASGTEGRALPEGVTGQLPAA